MNKLNNFIEVTEYPIYDGKEPIDKYLHKLKMYSINKNKDKYKIVLDFMKIWLAHSDIKLTKLLDLRNVPENKFPEESKNNEVMKMHCIKIIKALDLEYKYDKKINYTTKEMISFVRLMLKTIDYKIAGNNRNDIVYYKITACI